MTVPTQPSLPKVWQQKQPLVNNPPSTHSITYQQIVTSNQRSLPTFNLRTLLPLVSIKDSKLYANMHQHSVAGTAGIALITPFLVLLGATGSNAQACAAGTAQEINGNWYCSEVNAIAYTNFPGNGSYNKVTNMDAATGQCSFEQYGYSGSLSPLNEEVGAAEI